MPRPKKLTKHQVLQAIERSIVEQGVPPTVAELRRKLHVGSNRTVLRYLQWLEDDGDLERWPGARGIRVRRSSRSGLTTRSVPVIGTVRAGSPMFAEENWEGAVRLPQEFLSPRHARFFLLRVRGDSMNRAAVDGNRIEAGDLVLVRQQTSADSGDIIVALVDGEATIKRFVRAKDHVVLKPESTNSQHQAIIAKQDLQCLGRICRVLKSAAQLIEESD